MLTGIALIIFVIELQIPNPFPIPGIKLGLANIMTVYAVYRYRAAEVMMIVFCRIFLAAVFSGNMMALVYGSQNHPSNPHAKSRQMGIEKYLTVGRNHFAKPCFSPR